MIKMTKQSDYTEEQLNFLELLATQFPNIKSASNEVINLKSIMGLPKGTEHFISDIHGEYEAFSHIINSCSGVIKEKINAQFGTTMSKAERDDLATLIYYPIEKMKMIKLSEPELKEWYKLTLYRLASLCNNVTSKYSRSKVRKALPADYKYVMDELLHMNILEEDRQVYYENIIESIVETESAVDYIVAFCDTIKAMAADHLHIVGDIFDRGPRADIVMDEIMTCRSVDIQWGNHDILWMGAASGSRAMIATVVANSIHYNNLEVLETGYGISLRPLSVFANEVYNKCNLDRFKVSIVESNDNVSKKDMLLSARMHKAITIILFKLEGQKIMSRPEFSMEDRLLLDKINYETRTINIGGNTYKLEDCEFPTVDPKDPYTLTPEEDNVMNQLVDSFRQSQKLQKHIRFLYSNGSLYKVYNNNLLLHGCVPMSADGEFMKFNIGKSVKSGKAFLDYADRTARKAYYDPIGSKERQFGMDFLWWLWCGKNSPIFGREKITTFERRLIADKSVWQEPKNAYYDLYHDREVCEKILAEFGLTGKHTHIINGHIPVKAGSGESPIKGEGKLIVIDGGFCKAYQKTSGIAGYTLISTSHHMRIVAHEPFEGKEASIKYNLDIANSSQVFELMEHRVKISETDTGRLLNARIDALRKLIEAYRSGKVLEIDSRN